MRLLINNIAKVKHAEIIIDGITVIAGNNDTGKSTIGKVLFAMFNSMNGIEEKLLAEKEDTLRRNFISILQESLHFERDAVYFLVKRSYIISKIVHLLLDSESSDENILHNKIIGYLKDELLNKFDIKENGLLEITEKFIAEYKRVSSISDEKVLLTIVSRYFNEIFDGQISSLRNDSSLSSSAELMIKNNVIQTIFSAGICSKINQDLDITKKAIYIDNPFILEDLQKSIFGTYIDNFLQDKLLQTKDVALEKGAYDSVDINDKLNSVESILNTIINGKIEEKDYYMVLTKDGLSDGIHLQNLSTGLKSFILIELLLQKQILTTKDVLVLDEPEIHLHPEWQLKYAEAIVLLQKVFDLNIVINTHSATFLEAIDLFSQIHKISDKCRYYLSKDSDVPNMSEFDDVTGSLDKVYKSLVTPTMALMRLREQLEESDND